MCALQRYYAAINILQSLHSAIYEITTIDYFQYYILSCVFLSDALCMEGTFLGTLKSCYTWTTDVFLTTRVSVAARQKLI
jgi:hypothetical protein